MMSSNLFFWEVPLEQLAVFGQKRILLEPWNFSGLVASKSPHCLRTLPHSRGSRGLYMSGFSLWDLSGTSNLSQDIHKR